MVAGTVILHQGDPRRYKPWPLTSTVIPCDASSGPLILRTDVTVRRLDPLYMAHWDLTLSKSEDFVQPAENQRRSTRSHLSCLPSLSNNNSPSRERRRHLFDSGNPSCEAITGSRSPRKTNNNHIAEAYTKFVSRWTHVGKENRAPNHFKNMMTSLFAINQGSLPKKQANGSKHTFSQSKSFEEKTLNTNSPTKLSEPESQANTSETKNSEANSSAGGTKPKTHRFQNYGGIRRGSSSDDSVFLPQKAKVKYKPTNTSDSEKDRRSSRIHLSTLPSSTESDECLETRQGKILGSHKARNSRSKKSLANQSRSSSSSRSRSCSKSRTQRNRSSQPRSRSPSGSRASISSQLRRPSNSAQQLSDNMQPSEYFSDKVRNQSQNTDITGLNKSYSTIDNEAFLRRVEEVLSEIVEQKKRKIFQHEKHTLTLPPSRPAHHSLDNSKKSHRKPGGRWVVSKHYDVSEPKQSSFSHIITSHGDGRLRRRSKSSDLLETHKNCFTKLEPYKPRILRSDFDCRLLDDRNKQVIKYKKESRISVKPKSNKLPVTQPEPVPEPKSDETPRTDDQKSSTIEENLPTITSNNNTEADDTCYESEHGGSECALETTIDKYDHPHSSRQAIADQAEASVDSAYTGSRGPTPDDQTDLRIKTLKHKLHHREKHLEHKKKLTQEGATSSDYIKVQEGGKLFVDEPIVERIRREIICEIKDVGIYSDFAINTLLELYRRKYKYVSRKDMDMVTYQIRARFGLKTGKIPTTQDEDRPIPQPQPKSPKKSKVQFVAVESDSSDTPKLTKDDARKVDHDDLALPNEARLLQEVLNKSRNENDTVRWLSQDEIKEAKWASQILIECGIADETSKILDTATTWEEVSQALGVDNPFFRTIECGHEETFDDKIPSCVQLDCCTSQSPDIFHASGHDMKTNLRISDKDIAASVNETDSHNNEFESGPPERSCLHEFKATIEGNLGSQISDLTQTKIRIATVPDEASVCADERNNEISSSGKNEMNFLTDETSNVEDDDLPVSPDTSVIASETCPLVSNSEELTKNVVEINPALNAANSLDGIQPTASEPLGTRIIDDTTVHLSHEQPECLDDDVADLDDDDDFFDQTLDSDSKSLISNPSKLRTKKTNRPIVDLKEQPQMAPASEISPLQPCTETHEDSIQKPLNLTEDIHGNDSEEVDESSMRNILVETTFTEIPLPKDQKNLLSDSGYTDTEIQQPPLSSDVNDREKLQYDLESSISSSNPQHPSSPGKSEYLHQKEQLSNFNPCLVDTQSPSVNSQHLPSNSAITQSPSLSRRFQSNISSTSSFSVISDSVLQPASGSSCQPFPGAASSSQPVVSPTHPAVSPTHPAVSPTHPAVSPTQPAVSPTQPSLKGKIAALAAAYSSRADDTPDWLLVADEVCKQFNISL